MGKLTHLEAFLSDDGKRGREWKDERGRRFRRNGEHLSICTIGDIWTMTYGQAAAMSGECRWADEPKLLTPQEALRALEDGKCIEKDGIVYKIGQAGNFLSWYRTGRDTYAWKSLAISGLAAFRIVPDPSQPAEPIKPPLKVGDRVKDTRVRSRSGTVVGLCNDDRLVKVNYDDIGVINGSQVEYLEKIEAEPQLSPCSCMGDASCSCRRARIVDGGK